MILLVAMLAVALSASLAVEGATAKGPIKFKLCGESGCTAKKSPRFTAAMLYGGRLHAAPGCQARVHKVTAFLPGPNRNRRYLVVAARGLIGERGKRGLVWWRKVRGGKKSTLIRSSLPAGPGFVAGPEFFQPMLQRGGNRNAERWRLRSGRITCESSSPT